MPVSSKPVSRADLAASLATHDPAALRSVLHGAGLGHEPDDSARQLADRIADAIWWSYNTPLGYAAGFGTLEGIVADVARKLRIYVPGDLDGWGMIRELSAGLLADMNRRGVRVDELPPEARARLGRRWAASATMGAGAAGSAGAGWAAAKVAGWLSSPIFRWAPYIPRVGPVVGAVRTGAVVVSALSAPVALALAALSVNSALGANYYQLVPLLLGVGALGPAPVAEAVEVGGDIGYQRPAEA